MAFEMILSVFYFYVSIIKYIFLKSVSSDGDENCISKDVGFKI